jgi:C-methyltransferase C-terminal domain/Methyltransferase domain/Putative zinc binding domain
LTQAIQLTAGTGGSVVVQRCQVCDSADLRSVLFLGYLPPVNQMRTLGQRPAEQPAYPAELLHCGKCQLVQLGLIVDPGILFPPDYPYTSGTTKILRDDFADMCRECRGLFPSVSSGLVVDVGSNDGTLLSNWQSAGQRVRGIEPTRVGELANKRGIPTHTSFINRAIVDRVVAEEGRASVVTATNVFAHIENIHQVLEDILRLLAPDGIFVTESHYLMSLLETLQYDTIYHEHLRHYSLHSLSYLFAMHGLEVVHARRIPTHGGSIRVYAGRPGAHARQASVPAMLNEETAAGAMEDLLSQFRMKVVMSKLALNAMLYDVKKQGGRVYGVGAPSRASTLINYVGLDDGILDCVVEVQGSLKIGKYIPGTVIPVVEESRLFAERPEFALLLSWHIAEELMPKLRSRGFAGKFIVPLPSPHMR